MSSVETPEAAVLRSLARFILLSPEGQDHLKRLISRHSILGTREKFLAEGDPLGAFFVVLSGWAVEYRQLRDGRRQIVNFRFPGEIVGIESLLYGVSLYSAASLTPLRLATISRATFDDLQRRFPRVADAFLLSRIADHAILREWAVSLGRRSAFDRVAHLLLELELRYRKIHSSLPGRVNLPLTQHDVADCTGLTKTYVNRVLGRMRADNLLSSAGGCIQLLDAQRLARVSGFHGMHLDWDRRTKWQTQIVSPRFAVPSANVSLDAEKGKCLAAPEIPGWDTPAEPERLGP